MVVKKAKKWLSKEGKTLSVEIGTFEPAAKKLLQESKLI